MSGGETFGIGWAIEQMWMGGQVARVGWNGPGQFLDIQEVDENSKMTLPYIFITTVQGDRVPWLASQTDLLACDWQVVVVLAAGSPLPTMKNGVEYIIVDEAADVTPEMYGDAPNG